MLEAQLVRPTSLITGYVADDPGRSLLTQLALLPSQRTLAAATSKSPLPWELPASLGSSM